MNYAKAIELYLGRPVDFENEIQLFKDSDGVISIKKWRASEPQPTLQQLEAFQSQVEINEFNAKIFTQIQEIEAKQQRAIREFALGMDGSQERLQNIEAQITILRAQLTTNI